MSFHTSLVQDRHTKRLCLQVAHRGNVATHELPDEMATWDQNMIGEYVNKTVNEMIPNLLELATQDRKKKNRGQNCSVTSINSSQRSPEKI